MVGLQLVMASCQAGGPANVSLAQLAARQESYDGRQVRTQGVVRAFDDRAGRYYVIEDARPNRVELRPADAAARYDGQQIAVTGRFHFSEITGRSIDVERIQVAASR